MKKKDFKIKVMTYEWDVKYVAPNDPVLDNNRGVCMYNNDTIYIDKTLSEQQSGHAIYHELTHAILAESGFNIRIKDAVGDYYEIFVDALSKSMASCMEMKREV